MARFRLEEWVKRWKEIPQKGKNKGKNTSATVAVQSSSFAGVAIAAFRFVFPVCRKINGASAATPLLGYAPIVVSYEVFSLVKPTNNDHPHKAHKAVSDRITHSSPQDC